MQYHINIIENNCVKANKDRRKLSVTKIISMDSGFWQCKVVQIFVRVL